jgi:hypothetical protein
MKMVKRTLIAIAVVALLATSVQAVVPNGAVKEDGSWPTEYKFVDLCTMPVVMDVGMYVQVLDCADRIIKLVQVDCPDGRDFPCYSDCEEVEVRANFAAVLGTKLAVTGGEGAPTFSWTSYFDGDSTIPGDGQYHKVTVCVDAWAMEIWKAGPGDEVKIGELTLTVKPQ